MSDLEFLFLVLACLYFWECACWLKRGSVGFFTWLGKHWRVAQPGTLFGNQNGGFILAPPLPPLGCVLAGTQSPISLSPEAALAYTAFNVNPGWPPFHTQKIWRFDEIKNVVAKGKKLFINGELFLKAPSPTMTLTLAGGLRELVKMPVAKRQAAIEESLRGTFDAKAIKQRWAEFQILSRSIRWITNGLFVYLFVLAPLVLWFAGLKLTWPGLLVCLLALMTGNAIFFLRAHKKLFPEAEDERFTHFMLALLSPVTSIRARDTLSRPLLENFHPLAVANVFCAPEDFQKLAKHVVRDLRFPSQPVSPSKDLETESAARFTHDVFLKATEEFLTKHGIKMDELLQQPPRSELACASYCPRCHAQFTMHEGNCSDCGGLRLVPFA